MKYFILQLDRAYHQAPNIKNWYGAIDVRLISPDKAYMLPSRKLMFIEESPNTVFTDILTSPFFLVTKEFQRMIKLYDPLIRYKQIMLLDRKNSLSCLYFMPILQKIDCLAEGSVLNLDRSCIKKAVLDRSKIGDKSIFRLDRVTNTVIIVRLDFIESVLRRCGRGVDLKEVEWEGSACQG